MAIIRWSELGKTSTLNLCVLIYVELMPSEPWNLQLKCIGNLTLVYILVNPVLSMICRFCYWVSHTFINAEPKQLLVLIFQNVVTMSKVYSSFKKIQVQFMQEIDSSALYTINHQLPPLSTSIVLLIFWIVLPHLWIVYAKVFSHLFRILCAFCHV